MSILETEASTLCTIAEQAANMLLNEERCAQTEGSIEVADNLRKLIKRIRSILDEKPEPHEDNDVKAQFHREIADEKGLLR